jgi:tetrathionate reductase subunit A
MTEHRAIERMLAVLEAAAQRLGGQRMGLGVAAVSLHFGHWAYGSNDVEIDGETVKGDDRRSKGVCPNTAVDLDEGMETTCLAAPIGGSSSFYDTKVNLVKV